MRSPADSTKKRDRNSGRHKFGSPQKRRRRRAGLSGACLVLFGPLLIAGSAYATYGARIVTDLFFVYLFLLLPLGFLLLGYSATRRLHRCVLVLAFLATAGLTFKLMGAVSSSSEPGSAIQWYGSIYGPWLVGVGFVVVLVRGLVFVPRRSERGLCRGCGYDLRGLPEPRCPECGKSFDPVVTTDADN